MAYRKLPCVKGKPSSATADGGKAFTEIAKYAKGEARIRDRESLHDKK